GEEEIVEEKNDNLTKIKELSVKKKKKIKKESEPVLTGNDLMSEETEEQTRIRIVRRDEPEPQIKNAVQEDEVKKVDLQKVGEIPEPDYDKEDESSLPEQWEETLSYKRPPLDLLEPAQQGDIIVAEEELKGNAELLNEKLKHFCIEIKDITVTHDLVVTIYA